MRLVKAHAGLARIATTLALIGSLLVTHPLPASATTETYRDNFDDKTFDGSNGSVNWSTPWIEVGESDGPKKGAIQADNDNQCPDDICLMIGRKGNDARVRRAINLAGASTATLSFTYAIHSHDDDDSGVVRLAVSGNGGSSWSTLRTYAMDEDVDATYQSFPISAYANASTVIRFVAIDSSEDSHIDIDNVQIEFAGNTAPQLNPISDLAIAETTAATFTATATDQDGDTPEFSLAGAPAAATIGTTSGDFSWTPTESDGPGSFTFDVVVSDGSATDTQSVTITVSEVNAPPVPAPIADQTSTEGDGISLSTFAHDDDIPTNTITFSATGLPPGLGMNPSTGTISGTVNGGAAAASPYVVTVVASDNGTPSRSGDTTFAWSIIAPPPASTTTTTTITTTTTTTSPPTTTTNGPGPTTTAAPTTTTTSGPSPTTTTTTTTTTMPPVTTTTLAPVIVNAAPTGTDLLVETKTGDAVDFVLSGTDADDDPLTYSITKAPESGMISGESATRTYTPEPGFSGVDTLEFTANDGTADSAVATVTIIVRPKDQTTSAADDRYASDSPGAATEIAAPGVLGNDAVPPDQLWTAALQRSALHGTVELGADGSFTYLPDRGFFGEDTFIYQLTYDGAVGDFAVVTIDVPLPAVIASGVRDSVVTGMQDSQVAPTQFASTGVSRTLVLMGRGLRNASSAMQAPALLLLLALMAAIAFGRVHRWPLFAKRTAIVGEVTSYDPEAGYGIVTEQGSDVEAFLHRTVVSRRYRTNISRGDQVRYRVVRGTIRDQVISLRPT